MLDFNDSETNIFDSSDIEEKTNFETIISVDDTNQINVNCKLWKPIDEKLNMFCKLRGNLTYGEHSFNLTSYSFKYDNKKFNIIQNGSLSLFQLDERLPFLYSSKQMLNINENTNTYYLKFKIGEYNNEYLMIPADTKREFGSIILLDECFVEGKELKCKLEKDVIEEYAAYNGQKFSISYIFSHGKNTLMDKDNNIRSIYGIYINYVLSKKNISVEIVKLLQDKVGEINLIAYETNVKDIDNVHSNTFILSPSNGENIRCFLKKTIGIPLVMNCLSDMKTEFSLGKIEKKTELNDINIKYNFIIQPINNTEKCEIYDIGGI